MDHKIRRLGSSKEWYNDNLLNEQILKNNRNDYYPFRYNLNNATTSMSFPVLLLYENQDLMIWAKISKNFNNNQNFILIIFTKIAKK